MEMQILDILRKIDKKLNSVAEQLENLNIRTENSFSLLRNHLIRVKNNEEVSDEMILQGRPYNDLSPERAYKLYLNQNVDYIFLDVSDKRNEFNPEIRGSIHIPISEIEKRFNEIYSKTLPILIISEDGINSIVACELLVKKGLYNVNNVSGGHKFWPGNQEAFRQIKSEQEAG